MVSEGLGRAVLFRRNVALDRGGRGHGYGAAAGGAAGHAELRRICAEGPVARPAVMEKSRVAPDTRPVVTEKSRVAPDTRHPAREGRQAHHGARRPGS